MRLQKTKAAVGVTAILLTSLIVWNRKQITSLQHLSEPIRPQLYRRRLGTAETYSTTSEPSLLTRDEDDQYRRVDVDERRELIEDDGFHLSLRYKPPPKAEIDTHGRAFQVPSDIVEETAVLTKYFIELNAESAARFVFATAASENHFNESRDGVASAQANFPGKSIYYYDLGLTKHQAEQIKRWKYVEYRKFNFSKYPDHFQENLRTCGWKPFIIRDVLKETGGVLWMDASVRVHSSNFNAIFNQILENGGLLLFKTTGHSNYVATHGDTYEFLPTRLSKQRKVNMNCAAAMLVYNTREMFYNVLWWWFLCAYDRRCLAPMEKNKCSFSASRRMETYANCHKYDQSTINILLSNYHGYNLSRYTLADYGLVTIERWPTNYFNIQMI